MQVFTGVERPEGLSRWRAGGGRKWAAGLGRWGQALRSPLGATAATLLGLVLLLAILGPILWGDRADAIDTSSLSQGSSSAHWLGTDSLGRDIFYRVLVATRLSVALALLATAIGVATGVLLGAAPWLLGRRVGRFAVATINVAVAFPALLLVLFFAVIFGVGIRGAVLAVGLGMAPYYARVTSTLVAGVSGRDYIAAARIAGLGRMRILLRHILPNIGEPLIVNATLGAGGALLAFAGLSFLGLGVQAPSYDWGLLLNEGLNGIYVSPAGALAPGVTIVLAGLAFNLAGEVVAKKVGLRTANVRTASAYGPVPAAAVDEARPASDKDTAPVLAVEDLHVTVTGPAGPVTPVRGVSFTIGRGEAVGLVGESGSGKSLTALAVAQLIEAPGRVDARRLEFQGTDLLHTRGRAKGIGRLLGTSLGVVFQDPTTSLNPTMRIGRQLGEVVRRHLGKSRGEARARAVDRLRAARVPAPERRAHQYPHEFSGGMRQRAMIAMAMMGDPALIVADEPTTALDVTVQRQVLRLLEEIRAQKQVAVLLISHDITVVGQVCDRVMVMYAGRVVEDLPSSELRTEARHPYTRALLAAVPGMAADRDRPLTIIPGRPVDPAHFPPGCAFADRCPLADDHCRAAHPPLATDGAGRRVACWHAGEPLPVVTEDNVGVGEAS
ncbi:dipeptide/oligopeptide/nickel ABC transporter permease/ATP-binding protein [Jiangella ureilytica]|uniref:Dipeptide/oligopeptide/nickel ABC transporter permease/ATP-binding protein n=1 Tax=Jiangella ureilytica TaxID=2530374 RepID=A0A4R4RTA2_9ACTN|nr:dipeptide/oligopeptide/nickel ABC transporter permease/ATP-binding protein [Jiangella ureilytica]TDC53281.1 dipeptide/oligopeptide/nickel ABC transporter permease/ATP-binding protein [Jiangella ureilytica]